MTAHEPIYERLWDDVTRHLHHHPDQHPAGQQHSVTISTNTTTKGDTTMSLATLANDIKTALEDGETRIRTVLDQHMPNLIALGTAVENNPVIQAAESAAHLPPSILQGFADLLNRAAAEFPAPMSTQPAADVTAAADATQDVPAEPVAAPAAS